MLYHFKKNRLLSILFLLTSGVVYAATNSSNHSVFNNQSSAGLIRQGFYTIPSDFREITLYPINHPEQSIIATLGVTALIAADKPITKFLQDYINPNTEVSITTLWNTPVTQAADGYLLAGVAGLYTGGLLIQNKQTQAAGIVAGKSVAYSYIYSQLILKSLFGRTRPNPNLGSSLPAPYPYTDNPWDFFHVHAPTFSSSPVNTSMPSFHFTLFFSVASSLQNVYDSYWPYLITLGTLPNFQDHNHWFSDMVAGSLIGVAIGYQVSQNYLFQLEYASHGNTNKFQFFPAVIPGGAGLAMRYTGD